MFYEDDIHPELQVPRPFRRSTPNISTKKKKKKTEKKKKKKQTNKDKNKTKQNKNKTKQKERNKTKPNKQKQNKTKNKANKQKKNVECPGWWPNITGGGDICWRFMVHYASLTCNSKWPLHTLQSIYNSSNHWV